LHYNRANNSRTVNLSPYIALLIFDKKRNAKSNETRHKNIEFNIFWRCTSANHYWSKKGNDEKDRKKFFIKQVLMSRPIYNNFKVFFKGYCIFHFILHFVIRHSGDPNNFLSQIQRQLNINYWPKEWFHDNKYSELTKI